MTASLEEFTQLIASFDPSSNPRYAAHIRRLYKTRDSLFRKRTATIYEVAWIENIGFSAPNANPMKFTMNKRLMPRVWITDDKQLIVYRSGRYVYANITQINPFVLDALYMGLKGDFARIDDRYETKCRRLLAEHIDYVVRQNREKRHRKEQQKLLNKPKEIQQALRKLAEVDDNSPEYQQLKNKLLTQMST